MMPKIYHKNNLFTSIVFISLLFQSSALLAAPERQGPYLGIYFGAGLGNNDVSTKISGVTDTSYFATSEDIEAVNHAGSWTDNPNTAIIGIQAGHDWAWKKLVYGLVLDYGALTLDSSEDVRRAYPVSGDTYSMETTMSTNWLFTLRGRLGYQTNWHWPNFLYVTGGMAMTNLEVDQNFRDNSGLAGFGESNTTENQIGWTAGMGIELGLFKQASISLEYLYVQIPSVTTTGFISNSAAGFGIPANSLTNSFSTSDNFSANLLKIVVNYRFDE